MSINRFPTHWNDLGMDWSDPDPLNVTYHYALQAAIEERIQAKPVFFHAYNSIYKIQVQQNMVINASLFRNYMKNVCDLLYYAIKPAFFFKEKGTYEDYSYYGQKAFFSDVEAMVLASISQDMTIEQMKRVMIQLKTMLDNIYLFPAIVRFDQLKTTYFQVERGAEYEIKTDDTILEKTEKVKNALLNKIGEELEVSDEKQSGYSSLVSSETDAYVAWNAASITIAEQHPPFSPQVRSFCRPELLCLTFPSKGTDYGYEDAAYYDFGTGLQEGVPEILDYGQFSGTTDSVMTAPIQYNMLAPLQDPDVIGTENRFPRLRFYCPCIFVFNYNVEGGFKFRPDSEN